LEKCKIQRKKCVGGDSEDNSENCGNLQYVYKKPPFARGLFDMGINVWGLHLKVPCHGHFY